MHRIDAFSTPIRTAKLPSIRTCTRRHSSASNSEWQARNIYDDLDRLRQSIAKDQAQDRLQEIQRRQLMNTFAANRRPLFRDLRRFLLIPILSALLLTGLSPLSNDVRRIRLIAGLVFRVEFWVIVVAAPMSLLLQAYRSFPSTSTSKEDEGRLPPRRARALYSTLIQLDAPEDPKSHETVMHLLEQWVSAVAGTALLGACFAITQTGRTYARLWPWLRFTTRLGVIASLHQYPKLLYDLRRQVRPLNKFECRLQQLSKRMLQLSLFGLTFDLSEMMLRTLPRAVLLSLCVVLIMLCDLKRMVKPSDASTLQGLLQEVATKATGWFPYLVSGRLLWLFPFSKVRTLLLWGVLPIGLSITAPLLHLVAVLRLGRIQHTHNLSLANKDTKFILQDPEALTERMKWRYRLEWRQPTLRVGQAVLSFVDDFVYRLFFQGGVQDKFLESSQQQIQRDTKDLEEKVQELDEMDPMDSTKWKEGSMKNLAREHQRDYNNESFRDPLGVAIQQTFGIGLGYAGNHMDPLPEGAEPSARRLQTRAAKSAIMRVQAIYDSTLEVDLDVINDFNERETIKAELRQREQAEKEYLARQMTELIPQEDDGDFDDPTARFFLPKTSIRKMIRPLLEGVSEYDESVDPALPWGDSSSNT